MVSWEIKKFVSKNRLEILIFLFIIMLSAFLRFYKIDQYMTFLGDEGRDALVIKDLLVNHHIPAIGPPTSIGNMYNGPLYYYMMAVPMLVFWLNPASAAWMVALIGTATVGLVYYLSREWFGKVVAAVAALMYAVSPVNIVYSRSSWNPNPAPFFAMLLMLGLYKAHQTKNYKWFILAFGAIAFAIQMHYLSLLLVPLVGILWLFEVYLIFIKKQKGQGFWLGTWGGVGLFGLLMLPLVLFDLKHDFLNYKAFSAFFFGDRATTVNLNVFNTLNKVVPIYSENLISRYITGENIVLVILASILIIVPVLYLIWRVVKKKPVQWHYSALSLWLIIGVVGLSLNKQHLYDHYLTFFNPAPFIMLASIISLILFLRNKFWKNILVALFGAFLAALVFINLFIRSPLQLPPNNQLSRTQDIAKYIIQLSNNQPFNFALIAEHNYDAAYQFYLDIYGHKPEKLPFVKTDQLLVVCEDPVCNPVGHRKEEIADFGWTKVDFETQVDGLKVYRLIHNPTEPTASLNDQ